MHRAVTSLSPPLSIHGIQKNVICQAKVRVKQKAKQIHTRSVFYIKTGILQIQTTL